MLNEIREISYIYIQYELSIIYKINYLYKISIYFFWHWDWDVVHHWNTTAVSISQAMLILPTSHIQALLEHVQVFQDELRRKAIVWRNKSGHGQTICLYVNANESVLYMFKLKTPPPKTERWKITIIWNCSFGTPIVQHSQMMVGFGRFGPQWPKRLNRRSSNSQSLWVNMPCPAWPGRKSRRFRCQTFMLVVIAAPLPSI